MKSQKDERTLRLLTLIKIDANDLFERIKKRKVEYLEIFALRRTREHFPRIFTHKFSDIRLTDLLQCSEDLITVLHEFYRVADELSWYLYATEDMPGTVETFVDRSITKMEKHLMTLNLYLNVEIGVETDEASL